MEPNLEMKSKFLLDNRGEIWSRSYSVGGTRTEEQLRYGKPQEATHLIGDNTYQFWVCWLGEESNHRDIFRIYCDLTGYKA